jgi:hypothetical protein
MQYQQTRVQSAEFLRLAVGHMGRQETALDPASYTLWYEHFGALITITYSFPHLPKRWRGVSVQSAAY